MLVLASLPPAVSNSLSVSRLLQGENKTERDPAWASATFSDGDDPESDKKLAEAMCLQVAETLMGAKGEEENVTGAKRWVHLKEALSFISLDRAAMAEGDGAVGLDDDDDQLAHTVLAGMADDFGTDQVMLILKGAGVENPSHYEKVCLTADKTWVSRSLVPAGRGVAHHVIKTHEKVNSAEAHTVTQFDPEIDRCAGVALTHSILCVPLMEGGKPVGVLHVTNKSPKKGGIFTPEDESYLQAIAMVTVPGIAACTAAEDIDTLQRKCDAYLAVAGLKPEADPAKFFATITRTMQGLVGADATAIHLLNKDATEVVTIRRIGDGENDSECVFYSKAPYQEHAPGGVKPDAERLAKRVMVSRKTINVPNAINHPVAGGFIPAPDDETGTNNMLLIQNVLAVPITVQCEPCGGAGTMAGESRGGYIYMAGESKCPGHCQGTGRKVLGALEGLNKSGEQNTHFTEVDITSLEQLAELAACAIERLELNDSWERTDRRRRVIRSFSVPLSSPLSLFRFPCSVCVFNALRVSVPWCLSAFPRWCVES